MDDNVEAGDGWLPSETPLPGELWSLLSPLLLQVWSGMLASSLNSCPDIILSISSSDICLGEGEQMRESGTIRRETYLEIQPKSLWALQNFHVSLFIIHNYQLTNNSIASMLLIYSVGGNWGSRIHHLENYNSFVPDFPIQINTFPHAGLSQRASEYY